MSVDYVFEPYISTPPAGPEGSRLTPLAAILRVLGQLQGSVESVWEISNLRYLGFRATIKGVPHGHNAMKLGVDDKRDDLGRVIGTQVFGLVT